MRPTDPRLRPQLAPARRQLAVVLVAGGVGSLLMVLQAWAVTGLVVAALDDGAGGPGRRWCVAVFAARARDRAGRRTWPRGRPPSWAPTCGAAWSAPSCATAGAGRSTGELAGLATRGVDGGRALPDPLPARRWSSPPCSRH